MPFFDVAATSKIRNSLIDNKNIMVIRGTELKSGFNQGKKEVYKCTRIGGLIYVEEYTCSDGTIVSGFYIEYPYINTLKIGGLLQLIYLFQI